MTSPSASPLAPTPTSQRGCSSCTCVHTACAWRRPGRRRREVRAAALLRASGPAARLAAVLRSPSDSTPLLRYVCTSRKPDAGAEQSTALRRRLRFCVRAAARGAASGREPQRSNANSFDCGADAVARGAAALGSQVGASPSAGAPFEAPPFAAPDVASAQLTRREARRTELREPSLERCAVGAEPVVFLSLHRRRALGALDTDGPVKADCAGLSAATASAARAKGALNSAVVDSTEAVAALVTSRSWKAARISCCCSL